LLIGLATLVAYPVALRLPIETFGNLSTQDLWHVYLGGTIAAVGIPLAVGVCLRGVSSKTLARVNRFARPIFFASAAFFAIFVVWLAVLKLYSFHMYADLANNLEILWREVHGLGLTSPMFAERHGGLHWFGGHFAPIAFALAHLVFRWLPAPETLIVVQALALLSAGFPVMLYARERIDRDVGYWLGTAFFMYPTIQFVGLYDFGYLQLSIPFLCWAFYSWARRRVLLFYAFVLLALLCREEVGFVVFALGLYIALVEKRGRVGATTAVLGLGYSLTVIQVLMPWFRDRGELFYLQHYDAFGTTPVAIVTNVLTNPSSVARRLIEPTRIGNAVMFLLPLQFTSLASPALLAVTLPNVAAAFLTGAVSVYSFFLYYLSPSIPLIFFSSVEGLRKLARRVVPEIIGPWIGLGALVTTMMFGPSPVSLAFWNDGYKLGEFHATNFHRTHYAVTDHARSALRLARLVPRDVVVSAEQPFLPHLFDRSRLYVFPRLSPDVDYVLIDRKHPLKSGFGETYLDFRRRPEYYYAMIESAPQQWILIHEEDGVRLFKRRRGV